MEGAIVNITYSFYFLFAHIFRIENGVKFGLSLENSVGRNYHFPSMCLIGLSYQGFKMVGNLDQEVTVEETASVKYKPTTVTT